MSWISDDAGLMNPERLARLGEDVLRASRPVRDARARGTIEADVVARLLEGERTITEMVEAIYRTPVTHPEFKTNYMRVWRAVRDLESKGYVSRPMLGRQRPYRLTRLCLDSLLSPPTRTPGRLVAWLDITAYTATIMLAAFLLLPRNPLGCAAESVLVPSFYLLFGVSLVRAAQTLTRPV